MSLVRVILQNRHLLWQFTRRQVAQRHRGSILGAIWSVLLPLVMMAVYTVVFGLIFKGRYSGVPDASTLDYALGIFLSITIFQFVSETLVLSPISVVSQPNMVKKVVFPLEILPLATIGTALVQFLISCLLVVIAIATLGHGLGLSALLFPLTLLPLFPLLLGIALIASALGVFLRDIQQAAGPLSMVLMYSSAVFYSSEMIPPAFWTFLKYNPILHVIEQSRRTLLWQQPVQWEGLGYSLILGFVVLLTGIWVFRKLKPAFADVL